LIGIHGKAIKPATNKVSSLIVTPLPKRHSDKPAKAREALDLMYPGLRKIELFARERHPGWEVWGDQLPRTSTGGYLPEYQPMDRRRSGSKHARQAKLF
jgi:N6-adenosine-specific RNA methylase IME4